MAKSKNGGSRAYIRGRIGSDVYSVGKDGMGKKQQVVRSLAVQVTNPRSQSQMFNRMIMSTVMQAVSALSPIIDHSFDGVAKGQPSISEFIRRNYALVKADALAHPSTGNMFSLNAYQQKGIRRGKWVISDGAVVVPAAISCSSSYLMINLGAGHLTVGDLKAALGAAVNGYLTMVAISDSNGEAFYLRAKLTTTLADETTITSENVGSLFTFEGSVPGTAILSDNKVTIYPSSEPTWSNCGVIVSENTEDGWKHSACTLALDDGAGSGRADNVLPTYPVGTEQFLNGGDI